MAHIPKNVDAIYGAEGLTQAQRSQLALVYVAAEMQRQLENSGMSGGLSDSAWAEGGKYRVEADRKEKGLEQREPAHRNRQASRNKYTPPRAQASAQNLPNSLDTASNASSHLNPTASVFVPSSASSTSCTETKLDPTAKPCVPSTIAHSTEGAKPAQVAITIQYPKQVKPAIETTYRGKADAKAGVDSPVGVKQAETAMSYSAYFEQVHLRQQAELKMARLTNAKTVIDVPDPIQQAETKVSCHTYWEQVYIRQQAEHKLAELVKSMAVATEPVTGPTVATQIVEQAESIIQAPYQGETNATTVVAGPCTYPATVVNSVVELAKPTKRAHECCNWAEVEKIYPHLVSARVATATVSTRPFEQVEPPMQVTCQTEKHKKADSVTLPAEIATPAGEKAKPTKNSEFEKVFPVPVSASIPVQPMKCIEEPQQVDPEHDVESASQLGSDAFFDDKISNDGVEFVTKESLRATQGKSAAEELLDWDGTRLPAVCDWDDRTAHDIGYMPKWIETEWVPCVPTGPSIMVDVTAEGFISGELPVIDGRFGAHILHPVAHRDVNDELYSHYKKKLHEQCSTASTEDFVQKTRKDKFDVELMAVAQRERHAEIAAMAAQLPPHPYAPAIPIYLRPAVLSDVSAITKIYNHYVNVSLATEDQNEVTEEIIANLLDYCKRERFPILVAVNGNLPPQPVGQVVQSKTHLPQYETVIGFAFAQTYNVGLSCMHNGRTRGTLEIQFYVSPESARRGVGRSLLDRLLQCLSSEYAAKDGYDWLNPGDDPVYQVGGVHFTHQVVCQIGVHTRHDPTFPWLSQFLRNSFFEEAGRLQGLARTRTQGAITKFADLIVFSKEILSEASYPLFS